MARRGAPIVYDRSDGERRGAGPSRCRTGAIMARLRFTACAFVAAVLLAGSARAQEMSGDYKTVLDTLKRTGDFKDGVLKVNVPRADLKVTIKGRPAPT